MIAKPSGLGQKYIEIEIDAEGVLRIEVHGFSDGSCKRATQNLEAALGKITGRKDKQGGRESLQQIRG
jgi:hypothetical protein